MRRVPKALVAASALSASLGCREPVAPRPAIALAPTSVSFTDTGTANPAPRAVSVTNSGGGSLTGLGVGTINYGAGASNWLTASLSGSTAPATLTFSVSLSGLAVGTYSAIVPITSSLASNSPQFDTVTFTAANGTNSTAWADGFENNAAGSWPSTWIPDGNASSTAQNYVDASVLYSGTHSLRLYGVVGACWASIAYRAVTVAPPFNVELAVRNGAESLSGCNPIRAEVHLRQCCSWTNPARSLVSFSGSAIKAGWAQSDSIASFVPQQWYTLRIRYEQPSPTAVRLTYWINGFYVATRDFTALSAEGSLGHLELTAIEGSAWFDDVKIMK